MVKVAREGAFSTACVGFCGAARGGFSAATRTGFSALVRTDSVRSFRVFLEIAGAVFAVITWTTSFVASSLRLSPPKLAGAKPWACAPALNVTETNAVASAKKNDCLRTSARYAGNHKPWQAFFFGKNHWRLVAYLGRGFGARGNYALWPVSIVREVIGPKSGRRTEHLAAVDVNPVSMSGHGFFFVRCNDCSASGRQTQDQSPIGCDTHDATAHRTSAASRGICGRTPTGAGAFGC